eukprot:m.64580 g.64580  ORF g.64580 m.64580 type:complete len:494 (+) comp14007_c0_seq4:311-1792(+)
MSWKISTPLAHCLWPRVVLLLTKQLNLGLMTTITTTEESLLVNNMKWLPMYNSAGVMLLGLGRRMLLPYKHTRYQTELNNTCDDSSSATPDPSTCANQWEHAYNVMDMSSQVWASGRWDDVRCTGACLQTAGDYVPEGSTEYTYDMLQPVASAKVMTRTQFDLRYGRVEITAKLPRGDWLWPALWLLPSHPDNYGPWPRNGEIDVMESRGNDPARCSGGYNFFGSTLHFGMDYKTDGYLHTTEGVEFSKQTKALSDEFHVYGLLWNTTHIVTYLDEPSNVIFATDMTGTDFYSLGQTTTTTCLLKDADNGMSCVRNVTAAAQDWSSYPNPWASPASFDPAMAPFDTPFYLIFNVAVGGTNGFFSPDCKGSDGSDAPWGSGDPDELPIDSFMKKSYQWLPTWVDTQDIAWAAHCSLGSAYQRCMPSNPPVTDMTQDGASSKLKAWYESNQATCTAITTSSACQQASSCEWHDVPCPETADHAALQVKKVVYTPN